MLQADHQLYASLKAKDWTVNNVLCKVFLPERVTDPINVHFTSSLKQILPIGCPFEFSFLAEAKNNSETVLSIEASKVYNYHNSTTSWGDDISEEILIGDPVNLQVTEFSSHLKAIPTKVNGAFWLTPSVMLRPVQMIQQSYTGNVIVETQDKFEFALAPGFNLSFDYHYRFSKKASKDMISSFPELVAEFEFESEEKIKPALSALDDFLLLTSFASRERCICLGWNCSTSNYRKKFYRREMAIPEEKKDRGYQIHLIDEREFKHFMDIAYKRFIEFEKVDSLRQAIQRVLYKIHYSGSDVFLTLYSGVETLVCMDDQEDGILSPENWPIFRSDLMKYIKKSEFLKGDERKGDRQAIYEKLSELNRRSFASVLKSFCEKYNVDLRNLWPIIDNKDGITLSEIRNRLIHGEVFNRNQYRALGSACVHLRCILERMILSILSWQISKSAVSFYDIQEISKKLLEDMKQFD